jgi:hypothetical protein
MRSSPSEDHCRISLSIIQYHFHKILNLTADTSSPVRLHDLRVEQLGDGDPAWFGQRTLLSAPCRLPPLATMGQQCRGVVPSAEPKDFLGYVLVSPLPLGEGEGPSWLAHGPCTLTPRPLPRGEGAMPCPKRFAGHALEHRSSITPSPHGGGRLGWGGKVGMGPERHARLHPLPSPISGGGSWPVQTPERLLDRCSRDTSCHCPSRTGP